MKIQTLLLSLAMLLASATGCTTNSVPSSEPQPNLLTTSVEENSQGKSAQEDDALTDFSQSQNPAALSEEELSEPRAGASPVKSDQVFMPGMEVVE